MSYYGYGTTYGGTRYSIIPRISTGTIVLSLAIVAFGLVAMWKVFEKAGKQGWIALVPFYNLYTLFEITWGNGWYFLLMFLSIIPILGYIAVFVILVMTYLKLAKAFGKSTGFAVGLIFLSVVFLGILAFDSSTYLGVPKKDETTTGNNPNSNPAPANNNFTGTTNGTSNQTTYCSKCGTALSQDNAFCPNCGTPKAN